MFTRRAYAVFKGGGIAAIAYVGALQELERWFEFSGYGGTSSGSVVALLAAAGLWPQEITEALATLSLRELLGPWRYLVKLAPAIAILNVFCFLIWLTARLFTWAMFLDPAGWLLACVGVLTLILTVYVNLTFGLVPKNRLRNFLVRLVRRKIAGFSAETTFEEFRAAGGKPLKIYATDLSGQRLSPFGVESANPSARVIPAVLASVSVPLFFWSEWIDGRCMTDGGISCTLPVFCFDREIQELRLPVIAFDLDFSPRAQPKRLHAVAFLSRLITTAIQSHDEIVANLTHRVPRLKIPIPEEIGSLDFNLTSRQWQDLHNAGVKEAQRFLSLESVTPFFPQQPGVYSEIQYTQAQHAPERLVVTLLKALCHEAADLLKVEAPRACIFMPTLQDRAKIIYHSFDPGDPDIDFDFQIGEGIAGAAWQTREMLFGELPGDNLSDLEKMNMVRPDRKSAFCVPLLRVNVGAKQDLLANPPLGVMVLDSSASIEQLRWREDAGNLMKFGKRWADILAKLLQ